MQQTFHKQRFAEDPRCARMTAMSIPLCGRRQCTKGEEPAYTYDNNTHSTTNTKRSLAGASGMADQVRHDEGEHTTMRQQAVNENEYNSVENDCLVTVG
jgi:hypothetical protein